MGYRWRRPEYLPTPAEIEKKCREIQRRWSARERDRRMRCVSPASGCAAAGDVEKLARAARVEMGSIVQA
jgi:hypothetical protein